MDPDYQEETQEDMAVKLEERILDSLFKIGGKDASATARLFLSGFLCLTVSRIKLNLYHNLCLNTFNFLKH